MSHYGISAENLSLGNKSPKHEIGRACRNNIEYDGAYELLSITTQPLSKYLIFIT